MKYDFTSIMDRHGKDAIAVDAYESGLSSKGFISAVKIKDGFDLIPMWVADMNFPTVPTIPSAIIARAEHPAYGYFFPTDAYFKAIIEWQRDRHGVQNLKPEDIGYENGVLGGVVSALRVLCSDGDKVILQSPAYIGFTHCIEDNGWDIVINPMKKDEQGIFRIDYEDLEKRS